MATHCFCDSHHIQCNLVTQSPHELMLKHSSSSHLPAVKKYTPASGPVTLLGALYWDYCTCSQILPCGCSTIMDSLLLGQLTNYRQLLLGKTHYWASVWVPTLFSWNCWFFNGIVTRISIIMVLPHSVAGIWQTFSLWNWHKWLHVHNKC